MYSFGRRTNLNAQSGANPTSKNPVIALTYSTRTPRPERGGCGGIAAGRGARPRTVTYQLAMGSWGLRRSTSKYFEAPQAGPLSSSRSLDSLSPPSRSSETPPPHPLFQISINYTHTVSRGPRTRTHWLKFAPDVCAWARPQNNWCFEGGRPDSRLRTPHRIVYVHTMYSTSGSDSAAITSDAS